jgi:hypothetical protein
MKIYRRALLAAALGLAPWVGSPSRADVILGSSYEVTGTGTPTDFDEMTTFDQTTKSIDGGALTIKETVTPVAGGGQWVDFFVQGGANGGPIEASPSDNYSFVINHIKIDAPAILTTPFLLFTAGGTPIDSGLSPGSGFGVMTNPMTGSGQVIDFVGFTPFLVTTEFGLNYFSNPFSFLFSLGVPDSVNGFHFAALLAPVPEPSSLALAGVGLAAFAWRRLATRRRPAA